jgi:hypothetical protein
MKRFAMPVSRPENPQGSSPDPLRKILQSVSVLAIRLNEWTIFLTMLRNVGAQLDGLTKYVNETAIGTPARCSDDAWKALQVMWAQLEQGQIEDFRDSIQTAQAVTSDSPVARPGKDLQPMAVLADLDRWLEAVRTADSEGSAGKLKAACTEIQKKVLRHTAGCLNQIKYESLSLGSLVSDLEKLL